MPDAQPIPDVLAKSREVERDILYLLTDPEDNQPLWTLGDLGREIERPDVVDYVRALQASGLVHRTSDGHVFASRAAIRHIQMIGHGVT